jgi:GT2 family glycosyltransferase/lipopolysaccharide/colanic/teichoic acid biosynthesis glycosyltransferase
MTDVSVIIVSYRTPDLLRASLEKLVQDPARHPREILVVDNASGDASVEVASGFPGVRVVALSRNLGFAGGVNRGIEAARGAYLFIMNPDVETQPGALDLLADFLDAHPETGIAAPKLLNTDGSLQYSCRRPYTLKTILLRRTLLGRLFPRDSTLRWHLMMDYDHAAPRAVDWVAGAAMLVRREAVQDVGRMEERYFLYFEDVDWCWRMQARGWLVHYVPDAVMVHHWQRASVGFGPAARRHLRSGLRFYDRWGGLFFVLRQNRETLERVLLVVADLAAFAAAFFTAYLARKEMAFVLHKPHWSLGFYKGFLAADILVFAAAFQVGGLYRNLKEGDWVDVAFRVGKAATLATLVLMAATFILEMHGYSRFIVLGSWPFVVAFTFLVRRILYALFTRAHRERWNLQRVALLGEGPLLDHLETVLRDHPEHGWDPVRIRRRLSGGEGSPLAGLIRQLAVERVSVVVLPPESVGGADVSLVAETMPLRRAGFGVRLASPFLASLPPQTRVEMVADVAWLSLDRPALRPGSVAKRGFDILAASIGIVVGALPSLFLVTWRKVAGKPALEPKESWRGPGGQISSGRLLAAGGWLRAFPLLPAVLRGELSLVGLRPLRPGEDAPGGLAWQGVREQYRPGLVGPWSLSGTLPPAEEMLQELRYLESWSPELDLKLLLRAALARRRNRGAGSSSVPFPGGAAQPHQAH